MKVLVTGGGGFLGSAILDECQDWATELRSFSRGEYPTLAERGVQHIQGDLTDLDALKRSFDGIDVVFHTAALPGAWGRYNRYFDANVVGSRNVLKAAQHCGVKAIVHTSTPSVVHANEGIAGAGEELPLAEHFLAHYPKTKAIAENEMLMASSETLPICALRPHLIWGPCDRHLIPRLVARARSGRLRLVGPNSPTVDSCIIFDAARAHVLAAKTLLKPAPACAGKAYFISQNEPWPIDRLVCEILNAVGERWRPRYISPSLAYGLGRFFEISYRLLMIEKEPPMTRFIASQLSTDHWFDVSAAKRDFGFIPEFSIEAGLRMLSEAVASGHYSV